MGGQAHEVAGDVVGIDPIALEGCGWFAISDDNGYAENAAASQFPDELLSFLVPAIEDQEAGSDVITMLDDRGGKDIEAWIGFDLDGGEHFEEFFGTFQAASCSDGVGVFGDEHQVEQGFVAI